MATREIKTTVEYNLFHLVIGNRPLVEQKVTRMMSSIKMYGQLQPIIVDGTYGLVDGQHRFEASKRLGLPVEYIVRDNINLSAIQEMNSVQDKWKMMDFMESYAKQGNEHYKNFLKFHAMYAGDFDISALIALCSKKFSREIKEGKFEFSGHPILMAQDAATKILEVQRYYKDATKLKFARVYKRVLEVEEFSHGVFLQKLALQRDALYPCVKDSQYVTLIENIYNYKKRALFGINLTKTIY